MSRIALDAMGGDRAPAETVAGAVEAAARGVDVVLVGDRATLEAELANYGVELPVVHASEVIGMDEDPARALREKPESSIVVCSRLVASGDVGGFVSAGSTGAAMAAAAVIVGRLPGVLRPTIASVFPTPGSPTVVLDSGANPEVKPIHLLQFAVMGSVVAQVYLHIEEPRVGLLNIGEEPGKGRELERQAYTLLEQSELRFVGNVEGRDLVTDRADVIVTDGFTGNIFLKTTEGAAQMVAGMVMEAISRTPPDVQAVVLPELGDMRRRIDYEETGGAHLVGVNGVVVIAHGASSRRAVANALGMAAEGAERDLVGLVATGIASA